MDLNDARVLVTGGATGIGRSTTARLVAAGAKVAICGRREDVLRRTADELGCHAFPCDVSDEAAVVRLVEDVASPFGGLDVLINNAAFGGRAPLLELERDHLDAILATNVVGAMLVARECARRFVEAGSGTIVNVGSTAARKGYPGGSAYAASKFALSAFTECWRAELRPHGVRVMQVNPSEVQTPFGGRPEGEPNPTKLVADDVAQLIEAMLRLEDRGFVTEATLWATNPR